MKLVARTAVAAAVCVSVGLSLMACSFSLPVREGLTGFGLSEACVPASGIPNAPELPVVVSPGNITLEPGEVLTSLEVPGVAWVQTMVGGRGVPAGTVYQMTDDMVLEPADDVALTGPGDWSVVLLVEPDGIEREGHFEDIYVVVNGTRYVYHGDFTLYLRDDCSNP